MKKIVECVPNFSEGRDSEIISKITDEIKKIEGVNLLDVDPGADTNRTVVTFAGSPEDVEEAAFQAIRKAAELIDMTKQTGAHPRMGATDVCPFVPVSGVTMNDCVAIAKKLGKRVAEELRIPVFLYEEAASNDKRKSLAYIREGEYEGMREKLKNPEFKPDFGDAEFNKKSGTTAIGAREFLIAYNINLNTKKVLIARKIANRIREKGRMVTNKNTGNKEQVPGTLKAVRAVGWYIDEYDRAQISVNLLNYNTTPLYKVFEEAEKFAREFGARVTGSELVGLIPLNALLETGKYHLKKQGCSTGVSESELIKNAIQSLGLEEISPFDPHHKIVEYHFRQKGKLAAMDIAQFADELASDSPAPGGGSVAALCGALSASLSSMVGNLTYGKKAYKEVWGKMNQLSEASHQLKSFFISAIDQDTEAFNKIMEAFTLPKNTEEDIKTRNQSVQDATKEAVLVPLEVLKKSKDSIQLALQALEEGNKNSISDAGVAALTAAAAAEGALYNVMINLQSVEDKAFISETKSVALTLIQEIQIISDRTREILNSRLEING